MPDTIVYLDSRRNTISVNLGSSVPGPNAINNTTVIGTLDTENAPDWLLVYTDATSRPRKIAASAVGAVSSVFGRVGDVVLLSSDVTTALGYSDIARTGIANTFTTGQIINAATTVAGVRVQGASGYTGNPFEFVDVGGVSRIGIRYNAATGNDLSPWRLVFDNGAAGGFSIGYTGSTLAGATIRTIDNTAYTGLRCGAVNVDEGNGLITTISQHGVFGPNDAFEIVQQSYRGADRVLNFAAANGISWSGTSSPSGTVSLVLSRSTTDRFRVYAPNGFEIGFNFSALSTAFSERKQGSVRTGWRTATDATRLGQMYINVHGIVSTFEVEQPAIFMTAYDNGAPLTAFRRILVSPQDTINTGATIDGGLNGITLYASGANGYGVNLIARSASPTDPPHINFFNPNTGLAGRILCYASPSGTGSYLLLQPSGVDLMALHRTGFGSGLGVVKIGVNPETITGITSALYVQPQAGVAGVEVIAARGDTLIKLVDATSGSACTIRNETPIGGTPQIGITGYDRLVFTNGILRFSSVLFEFSSGFQPNLGGVGVFGCAGAPTITLQTNNINTQILNAGADLNTTIRPYSGAYSVVLQGFDSPTARILELYGVSSTSTNRPQSAVNSGWSVATDATRTGYVELGAYYITTYQPALRVTADSGGYPLIHVPGSASNIAIAMSAGSSGAAPYIEVGQNGNIAGGSIRMNFVGTKLGLSRYSGGTIVDHFTYYDTSSGNSVLDCVFGGAGAELRYLGTTRVRVNATGIGFFGATPVAQQTMGAATAGATYTAAEQTMLQAVYNAVRNLGLGT